MKLGLQTLAVVALTVVGAAARAQPTASPAAATPPPPRYNVEIVIFANRDFDPNEEQFTHETPTALPEQELLLEPPIFDDTNFGPLAETAPPPLAETAPPPLAETAPPPLAVTEPDSAVTDEFPNQAEPFRFRLLRPDELELDAEYRKIENLSAYVALLHGGWVQQGLPEEQSEPIDLALLGAINPRGTVRVYLSRFLHINLDLVYQRPVAAPGEAGPSFGFNNELTELSFAPRYRLLADRNARSGELHYFDHPAFGVLVRITPVPEEPPDATQAGKPAA